MSCAYMTMETHDIVLNGRTHRGGAGTVAFANKRLQRPSRTWMPSSGGG